MAALARSKQRLALLLLLLVGKVKKKRAAARYGVGGRYAGVMHAQASGRLALAARSYGVAAEGTAAAQGGVARRRGAAWHKRVRGAAVAQRAQRWQAVAAAAWRRRQV